MVRRRVRVGCDGTGAEERDSSPPVVGHQLDQSGVQGGADELSRAEPERPFHTEPILLERLAVELGEQHTLGEVERAHRDGVVAEGISGDRGSTVVSARGEGSDTCGTTDQRRT